MNKQQLITDFSKRFNAEAPRLIFTHAGALCTLLGDVRESSITCTLTMGVSAAARRSNSGYIRLECTDTNICRRIRADALPLPYARGWMGADILYSSSLTSGYASEPYIRAAVIKALLRLNHAENTGIDSAAALCENGKHLSFYRALMGARRGYCTLIDGSELCPYPLPITGMLFLCASWGGTRHTSRPQPLSNAEKIRIAAARRALKAYRLSEFAAIVSESALEADALFKPQSRQRILAAAMRTSDGCLFARANGSRVIALAEADKTDFVLNKARNRFADEFGAFPDFAVAKSG